MSIFMERQSSSRPYTVGSFGRKLKLFQTYIEEFTHVDEELNPEERRIELQERLTNGYEPFSAEINKLFGSDVSSHDVKALFRKIAANPEAEVDWSELFGIGNTSLEQTEQLLPDEGYSIFTVSKRTYLGDAGGDMKRRDFLRNIKHVPKLDIFLSSSEKGVVCQWNSKFRLQGCIDINETSWITGSDYCPGLRKIIISCERSLCVWDYRAKQKHSNVVQIKPLEQTIHCMTYVPWKLDRLPDDCILYGDEHGYINILRLSSKDLHMKNTHNDSQKMVIDPVKLSNEILRRKVHNDWVVKVKYLPQLELFGSCSPCSVTSFVLGDLDKLLGQQPLRELSVPKGVNCFGYCARANVIATAGADKIIRMWHPLILTRPTGKLIGHLFTISELAVNENDQHLISLSTARVFRVWDVQTLSCLQVFTSFDVSPSEKRIDAMIYDPKRDRLITGCSTIETWPLTRAIQDSLQLPHTHDRSVSLVAYNSQMKQVVSICQEPVVKVWEMETGQLVYQIHEPHGTGQEVTAINVNTSGYRLVTGAYDGTIRIWDFGSGQLHKSFEPKSIGDSKVENPTITGIVYINWTGKQCLFVSSWGHNIRVFEDNVNKASLEQLSILSDEYIYSMKHEVFPTKRPLPPIGETLTNNENESEMIVNVLSTCQVTCLDFMPPQLLVASTTNGLLILWDIEDMKVIRRFDRGESNAENNRRLSRHTEDFQNKLVHACQFVVGETPMSHDMTSIPEDVIKYVEPSSSIEERHDDDVMKFESEAIKNDECNEEKTGKMTNVTESKILRNGDTFVTHDDDVMKYESEAIKNDECNEEKTGEMTNITESKILRNGDAFVTHDDDVINNKGETTTRECKEKEKIVLNGQVTNVTESSDKKSGHELMSLDDKKNDGKQFERNLTHIGIISIHQDGFIRFWSSKGELFNEVRMTINQRSSPVTALSYLRYSNLLITSDTRGYVMKWDIENFINYLNRGENATINIEERNVDQILYWRAHMNKIVALEQIKDNNVLISASTDASVRIWHVHTGHFIGFFGQPRRWQVPTTTAIPSTPLRPYDISEVPKKLLRKTKQVKNKPKSNRTVECPLAFDDQRWRPFRYSAREETRSTADNKKFFHSLTKPRHYNFHLDSSQSGLSDPAAVFRSLPVYKIEEPERLKTPAVNSSSWLTNPITGTAYAANKPLGRMNSELPQNAENLICRFPHAIHHNS